MTQVDYRELMEDGDFSEIMQREEHWRHNSYDYDAVKNHTEQTIKDDILSAGGVVVKVVSTKLSKRRSKRRMAKLSKRKNR